jgi:hypothetical protein
MGADDPAGLPAFLACFSGLQKLHIAVKMTDWRWRLDFETALSQHGDTMRDLLLHLGRKKMSPGMLAKINALCPNLVRLSVRDRKYGLYHYGGFLKLALGFS